MDHVRRADQIRRRVPDGPGIQRTSAVRGTGPKRTGELHRAGGRGVLVPVPERRLLREREVPGRGGRPADRPGGQFRVPNRRDGIQRVAVRSSVAVLHQGQVQRVTTSSFDKFNIIIY